MGPPKKRWKVDPEMDMEEPSSHSSGCGHDIGKVKALCKSLKSSSSELESSDVATSMVVLSNQIMQLKSLQRQMLERIHRSESVLAGQAVVRNKQASALDNLKAQVAVNIRTVDECGIQKTMSGDSNDECEVGDGGGGGGAVSSDLKEMTKLMKSVEPTSTHQSISEYFDGADVCDPEQREAIMSKLNSELTSRKQMERTVQERQDHLEKLRDVLSSKQKFIRELPNRLNDIERASMPLQKLCQKEATGRGGHKDGQFEATALLIGSDRRRRFQMAEKLPKPLYTLFYQIQSCLDVLTIEDDYPDGSLPFLELISSASPAVLLKVPLPDVSNSGDVTYYKAKKIVTIKFDYDHPTSLIVTTCGSDHGARHLIDELFPGDHGGDGCHIGTGKFVYQWSNYLAGMHFVQSEMTHTKMRQSATVVVKALIRRARAVATLNKITSNLSINSSMLVTHPDLRLEFDDLYRGYGKTKVSWTKHAAKSSSREITFEAKLEYGSHKLFLNVSIDIARYPSVTPHWSVVSTDTTRGGQMITTSTPSFDGRIEGAQCNTLYDEKTEKLLHRVNQDVLGLILPRKEDTFDWVLVQQLVSLIQEWSASFQ